MAPDVHFRGPAFATPDVVGRDRVVGILKTALDHVYRGSPLHRLGGGRSAHGAALWTAQVGEHELEGAQVLTFDADDLVADLAVMARPAPGAAAIGEAILKHLDFDPRTRGAKVAELPPT